MPLGASAAVLLVLICGLQGCWLAAARSSGASQTPQSASKWACVTSLPDVQDTYYYAIRLTDAWHVECSRNAKVDLATYKNDECAPFNTISDCKGYIQGAFPGVGQPSDASETLVCGKHHESLWGVPGYGDPTHWCERGFKVLRPQAQLYPSCNCKNPMTTQTYRQVCASQLLRGPVCDCFCTLEYLVSSLGRLSSSLKELSLHMTAWELFRHWYQVASGDALELGAATADQEVLNNIAEMVSLAKQHNVSGWQAQGSARGRLLLQGSEGPKVLGRYEWETISVGMDGYNKPGSWASKILVQDLSGGPPNSRATSQCKSIAKKYKFTGPDFKPASLCAPRTPLPKDHGSMYLTITPDCRVMVETVNINQAGERRVIQQGTHELFLGIAEVPCFGVHWSYPWSGIVGDQFYEIDSHGEMRNYMTGSTCSHNCLPSECVLHWKTDAWPDCSWAMKSHQVQSAIKEVPGRIGAKVAETFTSIQSIVEDVLKKMRDNEYKEKRQAAYDAYKRNRGGTTVPNQQAEKDRSTNKPKKFFTRKDGERILTKGGFQALNDDDTAGAWQNDMKEVVEDTKKGWNKLNPTQMWQNVRKVLTWPQCWGWCWQEVSDEIATWARIPDCTQDCVNTAKFVP